MARNPKQDANLKPVRSTTEARERGKNGGIASGESRRKKKEIVKSLSQTALDNITQADKDKIVAAVLGYAQRGSESHIKLLLDLLGENTGPAEDKSTGVTIRIEGGDKYGV